jgi:hypothetical protein
MHLLNTVDRIDWFVSVWDSQLSLKLSHPPLAMLGCEKPILIDHVGLHTLSTFIVQY